MEWVVVAHVDLTVLRARARNQNTTQTGWIVWRRKIIQDYVCEITVLFILNIRDVLIYISCSTAKSAPVASMLIL